MDGGFMTTSVWDKKGVTSLESVSDNFLHISWKNSLES